jgi:hypothetical protein
MTSPSLPRLLLGALAAALVAAAPAQATAPANDDLADATVLPTSSDVVAPYTTTSAGREPGEATHHSGLAGHTVWLRWTPKASGGVYVRTCTPAGAKWSAFEAYKGPVGATHAQLQVVVPESWWKYPTCDFASLKFMAVAGTTYHFAVDHLAGTAAGPGQLVIDQETTKPTTSFVNPPAVTGPKATFAFTSAAKEPSWRCRLDTGPEHDCGKAGQIGYQSLTHGEHTLSVRATDWYGNVESTWKSVKWTVDAEAAETTITSPPPDPFAASALFTFASDEPGATFQCTRDGAKPSPCSSPFAFGTVWNGEREFTVASIDAWGNVDPTPAKVQWTATDPQPVVAPRPQPVVRGTLPPATTAPTTPMSPSAPLSIAPVASPARCTAVVPRVAPRRALLTTGWRVRAGACRTAVTVRLGRKVLASGQAAPGRTVRLRAGRRAAPTLRRARPGARLTVVLRSTDARGGQHHSVRRATLR